MIALRIIILSLLILPLKGSKNFSSLDLVQVDCTILDWSGRVYKKYPGWLCIFFEDGSYISNLYIKTKLRNFSSTGTILWKKDEEVHHELELSSDKKRITYLSDEIQSFDGHRTRFDVFKVMDRNGVELYRWSTFDHWSEIEQMLAEEKKQKAFPLIFTHPKFGPIREFTHVNSLKEIPPNDLYPELTYMKPGNLIAGMNCLGFFIIFDPMLSRVEKVLHYQQHLSCNTHDAKVQSNGNILFFRNFKLKLSDGAALVEFNPMTKEIDYSHLPKVGDPKKSNSLGSVSQLPNGNLLYIDRGQADHLSVVEMRRDGHIVRALDQRHLDLLKIDKPYRARKFDLTNFLMKSW